MRGNQKEYWHGIFLFVILISSIFFYGCKKIDTSPDISQKKELTKDFFAVPPGTDSTVIRLIEEIKRKNNIKEFVTEFASKNGYPVWNKVVKTNSKKNLHDHNREDNTANITNTADTVVFIPFVINGQEAVNGFIKAIINDSIYLSYSLDEFYKNYSFDPTAAEVTGDKFAESIMYLNALVFGKANYAIIDKRLFHGSTDYSDTANIEKTIKVEPDLTRLASLCYSTTVWTITANWHCTLVPGFCTPTACDGCSQCVDYSANQTTAFNCFNEDVGGSGGSTGGGASGGGQIPPYFPCIPGPTPLLPGDPIPPCPPPSDDPGWEPTIIADPCDPYIQLLNGDVNFAAKFKELGEPATLALNYEKGYIVQDRATNNYVAKDGYQNTAAGGGIQWEDLNNISGTIHSHYSGLGEMFSPQDVISLAHSVIHNEGSDPPNLFIGVNTSSGPYLIKITNLAKFTIFANKIAGTKEKENKFKDKYVDKFRYSGFPGLNEKGFLQMLKDYGAANGLGFYRGNADCNQWTSLTLEGHASGPDTVEGTDCN